MIFIVEDEPVLRRSLVEFLSADGHAVEGFEDAEAALDAARASPPDLVVTDVQLPGMTGIELVERLGQIDPGVVRIVMTAHASVRTAVSAMRSGCYEYLEKPVDMVRLSRLVRRALDERRAGLELSWLRGTPSSDEAIVGTSPSIRRVREEIAMLASLPGDVPPVLLVGETGVGKSLLARELHRARFSADAPFIEVNCAALPGTLIEAELFGYERSAFTDAKQAKPGLFEAATGGSLFLDEIGELPLEAQAKLLRVVESGSVRRLGAVRERQVRTQLIAASNVDLPSAVSAKRFRADLYHRLAAVTLRVPPLRERGDDVVRLAERFLQDAAAKYRRPLTRLSDEALRWMRAYAWPGNVRELHFAVERAAMLAPPTATSLGVEHLRVHPLTSTPPGPGTTAPTTSERAGASVTFAAGGGVDVELPPEGVAFEEIERAVLAAALQHTHGNVVQAARLLHMKRDALRYRIRRLGLDDRDGAIDPDGC